MKLSRAKAFASIIFIAFCLLFSYQFLIFAQQPTTNIPAELQELLQGKSSDFSSAASQLKETDLPAALAVIELLKFKALHQEIPESVDQINDFGSQIKSKLAKSSVISFSKTDTCRKKIEATEIEIAGQKIAIPEYYISEAGLAITGVIPVGEAGVLFPDIQVNLFSQSDITEYGLFIDGKAIPNNKISTFKDSDELGLIFRPDLNADSILSIGTHTAEISVTNAAGEKAEKQWSFTVGVYSFNPPPIPEDADVVKEVNVAVSTLIKAESKYKNVRVVVYQDKTGKRHEEYVVDSSGQTIRFRNLKHFRKFLTKTRSESELSIFPKSDYAFEDNELLFFYSYLGAGEIVDSKYSTVGSFGPWVSGSDYECILDSFQKYVCFQIKVNKPDPDNEGEMITVEYSAEKTVKSLSPKFSFANPYNYVFTRGKKARLPFERALSINEVMHANKLEEGSKLKIPQSGGEGILAVVEFRAIEVISTGSVELKDKIASQTEIIFESPGYMEITQKGKLSYRFADEVYEQEFKDERSTLNALFNVQAEVDFEKYPLTGLISSTEVFAGLKSLTLKINDTTKIFKTLTETESPLVLLESKHDQTMEPIKTKSVRFEIEDPEQLSFFSLVDFGYRIVVELINEVQQSKPELQVYIDSSFKSTLLKFDPLPEYSIFPKESDLIKINIDAPKGVKIYEGDVRPFKVEIAPTAGMGFGALNSEVSNLVILDFYKPDIDSLILDWWELPMMDDIKGRQFKETEFEHIFDPWWGTGKYELSVDTSIGFEAGYDVTTFLTAENKIEVEVLPGFSILSPIDSVAYPLGAAIKVTTSVDEDLDKWEKIEWELNGENFKPGVDQPPFYITPKHSGSWSLVASLSIESPESDRKPVPLKSRVEFLVQPVNYSLSPARKVLPKDQATNVPLELNVEVNGQKIEKPGDQVPWQEDFLLATVDKVEWAFYKKEDGCATHESEEEKFQALVNFNNEGAVTALATITVRLLGAEEVFKRKNPFFKDRYEEPAFELPAARADLWAVSTGMPNEINGLFPQRSIAQAYRTYRIDSFEFNLNYGQTVLERFSREKGFSPGIALSPALVGIASISASPAFKWEVISTAEIKKKVEVPTKLIIKPSEKCDYRVVLQPALDFGTAGSVPLSKIETSAIAVSLFSLIDARVDPASFTVSVGKIQTLKYFVKSLEQTASGNGESSSDLDTEDDTSVLYVLDKSFALSVENVEWSDTSVVTPSPVKNSIEGNPYDFSKIEVGVGTGSANCVLSLKEVLEGAEIAQIADTKIWTWKVNNPALLITVTDPEGNEAIVTDEIALSSLGVTTKFRAFYSDGLADGFEPIAATWALSGGDVKDDQPIRRGILKELNANIDKTYKIGVFLHRNATCTTVLYSSSVNFASYLSSVGEPMKMVASISNGVHKTISIRLKQPKFEVKVWPVDSVGTEIFVHWQTVVKEVWNRESILQVGSVELGSHIGNIIAPNPPLVPLTIPNAEALLPENGWGPPSFMNPIVFDSKLVEHFGENIVPRQPYELFSSSRDSGKINVYLVEAPLQYSIIFPAPPSLPVPYFGFTPNMGWTIDSNGAKDFSEPGTFLNDSLKSGICIKRITPPFTNMFKRVLAHEIGHTIIQTGDEHFLDGVSQPLPPGNLMEGGGLAEGLDLVPAQYISILNLDGKKTNKAIFIREE